MLLSYGEGSKRSEELTAGLSLLSTTGRADSVKLIELSGYYGLYEDDPHDFLPPLAVDEEVLSRLGLQGLLTWSLC